MLADDLVEIKGCQGAQGVADEQAEQAAEEADQGGFYADQEQNAGSGCAQGAENGNFAQAGGDGIVDADKDADAGNDGDQERDQQQDQAGAAEELGEELAHHQGRIDGHGFVEIVHVVHKAR